MSKTGDEENALDLVQELFIDIWQRRDAIKIEKSVETYLISALFYKVFMQSGRVASMEHSADYVELAIHLNNIETYNYISSPLVTIEVFSSS